MVTAISERREPLRTWSARDDRQADAAQSAPPPTTELKPQPGQSTSTDVGAAGATTERRPTAVTRADARAGVRADLTAQQLRSRAEAAAPQINGGGEAFPANGSVDDAKKYLADHPPSGDNPSTWTADQLRAFDVVAHDFGARHAEHHEAWHHENGAGGTRGPGSGELFLEFHRAMMNDFRRDTGVAAPTGWDPSTPVPSEITDPEGARSSSDADVHEPSWLTIDGNGTEAGNDAFGATVTIDGKTFNELGDFENPDQLGRALGESGYHASAHKHLGGTMNTFQSPRDSAFYLWHGHIDGIVNQWLETENGKAWAAASPDSPLLDPNLSAMSSHDGH